MDLYDREFKRAQEAVHLRRERGKRDFERKTIEVYEADQIRFTKLCSRYNLSAQEMFHSLLHNG